MPQPHEGAIELQHVFSEVCQWLQDNGNVILTTDVGTEFTAKYSLANRNGNISEQTIRFFQNRKEYGRAYNCCWGHYYNCNRTRIGMYCKALSNLVF